MTKHPLSRFGQLSAVIVLARVATNALVRADVRGRLARPDDNDSAPELLHHRLRLR